MDRGMAKSNAAGSVPPTLSRLVPELDLPAAEVTPITALPTKLAQRATFCLRSSDGKRVKLRIVTSAAKARRMQSVCRHLQGGAFARVLARHENYLLEEWVDGPPLDRIALSHGLLTRCGQMLADVHRRTLAECFGNISKPDHRQRLVETLSELRAIGIFSSAECRQLWRVASAHRPRSGQVGIVHRDFCADNLVLRGGRPISIDNANLSIGYFDEDIARTWYRWPMTRTQWRVFLEGYSTRRDVRSYRVHAPFWLILVLGGATLFRHRAQASFADYPQRLLTSFLSHRGTRLPENRFAPTCRWRAGA